MFDSIKDFLLNKALGRILVRVVASLAASLASGKLGVKLELTPDQQAQLLTGAVTGANAVITWLKPRIPALPDIKVTPGVPDEHPFGTK